MIAAFVVMHDTTLDELCRKKSKNLCELREISGMGEKKCEMYGQNILGLFPRFEKEKEPARIGAPSHRTPRSRRWNCW